MFMLVVTGICYGLTYTLVGVGVGGGIPPTAFAFWMSLGAGILMLLLCIGSGSLPGFSKAHLVGYFSTGIAGFGIPYIGVTYASVNGVPSGIISMLVALAPILTYLGAVLFRLEKLWWVKTLGFLVGIGGVLLIVVPDASLPEPGLIGWVLLSLCAPFGYAASALAAALLPPPKSDAVQFTTGFFLAAAIFIFAFMAGSGQWWWFEGPLDRADWALITSVPLQALGIYLFIEIIRIMGPVFFTTVNFITPVTGILWGMALLDERLSTWALIALVPLFMGVFFVNLRRKT